MKKMTMMAGVFFLALLSASTLADDGMTCNYQLDYDFSVNDSEIIFKNDSGTEIKIDPDNRLFLNGTKKTLTDQQQQLIESYGDGIRDLIPEATAIAVEGVNLGVKAAGIALGVLLGEDDPDFERFNSRINELAEKITMRLDDNNFDSRNIEAAFDNDFQQEIETVVQQAITELTPRLMAKIVTAAMSGDTANMAELEERVSFLENDISSFIEPQAEALEARVEAFCKGISALDAIETEMVATGLQMMDLINKDSEANHGKSKTY